MRLAQSQAHQPFPGFFEPGFLLLNHRFLWRFRSNGPLWKPLRSSKPADWMATTASSLTLAALCWQVIQANTAFNSSHGIGTMTAQSIGDCHNSRQGGRVIEYLQRCGFDLPTWLLLFAVIMDSRPGHEIDSCGNT